MKDVVSGRFAPSVMVVLASECPPDDQPWLITSRAELARDQEELAEAKRTHAATFPTSATFAAKHKWASQIDQEERYGLQRQPEGPEAVLPLVVYDAAPQQIELQLLIERRRLSRSSCATSIGRQRYDSIPRAGGPPGFTLCLCQRWNAGAARHGCARRCARNPRDGSV